MEKKKMIAVLAITVMAVPLALVGCGGGGEVIEPHNPPEIIQNIDGGADHYGSLEDELSNAGVVIITPSEEVEDETTVPEVVPPEVEEEVSLLDESTAGTYYIIDEDQSVYANADESSEVVDTYTVDTEITVSGMWGETGMFQVVDADGNVIGYVHSGYCDTIKGGYVVDEDTAIPDSTPSDESTTDDSADDYSEPPTKEEAQETLPSSLAGLPWYEALSPEEKAKLDHALQNTLSGNAHDSENDWSWADKFESGNGDGSGTSGTPSAGDFELGDGSSWTGGDIVMD